MTPWMVGMVAAEAETIWKGAKQIGFWRTLIGVLVIFLMSLVTTYISGDLKAEQAIKQNASLLEDMNHRMQAQTQQLDDIERMLKMLANLAVEQCINGSEVADRSRANCTAIAGGNTPWVR